MQRNLRLGMDVTRRCQNKCKICFYRWNDSFNTPADKSLPDAMKETQDAKARGCNHVVLVGQGEPALWPQLLEYIQEVKALGMTSSIITNGTVGVAKYAAMKQAGLNHLHISVHGLGDTLDEIVGVPGSAKKQRELFHWLRDEKWPWRMNMTVQRHNYKELAMIAEECLSFGCKHIISLGFLPHYEWGDPDKMKEVAVHPAELRSYIEATAQLVEAFNTENKDGLVEKAMLTIRYHPMCHIAEKYRKYIVNAQYVLFDPWEWDYSSAGLSEEEHLQAAMNIGHSVRITSEPCKSCGLMLHCGGWNKVYAAGFNGADLQAIEMPPETKQVGWLHDKNPANSGKGFFE